MSYKIIDISTTEDFVMNPEFEGWRYARIEVYIKGQHYPVECGYIKIYNNNLLFEAIRDKIENLGE